MVGAWEVTLVFRCSTSTARACEPCCSAMSDSSRPCGLRLVDSIWNTVVHLTHHIAFSTLLFSKDFGN